MYYDEVFSHINDKIKTLESKLTAGSANKVWNTFFYWRHTLKQKCFQEGTAAEWSIAFEMK